MMVSGEKRDIFFRVPYDRSLIFQKLNSKNGEATLWVSSLSKHMCFQLALLGWNSPGPKPGQLPPVPTMSPTLTHAGLLPLARPGGLDSTLLTLLPPHPSSIPSPGVGQSRAAQGPSQVRLKVATRGT